MTTTPNLSSHRRRIRRRMTATVAVTYVNGTYYDPELGYSVGNVVTVWEGPAHIRPTPSAARVVDAAGEAVSLRTYDVWLPVEAVVPDESTTRLTVTASAGDPRLVGVAMSVLDQPLDDWQTARRLVCQT